MPDATKRRNCGGCRDVLSPKENPADCVSIYPCGCFFHKACLFDEMASLFKKDAWPWPSSETEMTGHTADVKEVTTSSKRSGEVRIVVLG